jgi:hypothetical protein
MKTVNKLYANVFKSLKTTLLGLVIIALSIYSVFIKDGLTWGDASIPIVIGITLILAPDSIIKLTKKFLSKDDV